MLRYRAEARITGLIYIRPIHTNKIGRSEAMLIKMFKELCGEDCLDRVILVTNRWRTDPAEKIANETRELRIATDPRGFGSPGATEVQVRRLNNEYTREDGLGITEYFWNLPPVTLKVQKEVVDEGKPSLKTAAGISIGGNLMDEIEELKQLVTARDEVGPGSL